MESNINRKLSCNKNDLTKIVLYINKALLMGLELRIRVRNRYENYVSKPYKIMYLVLFCISI